MLIMNATMYAWITIMYYWTRNHEIGWIRLLLLDEPTTYLDLSHQIEVLELLKELNRKFGKTIVIVHHELNQAAKYGDNLICMKSGQVYSTGTVDNVFNEKMLKEVFGVNAIIIDDPISNRPMCIPM